MPILCDPAIAAENAARTQSEKLKPEDIDSDWLDNMVTRLFDELGRQMKQVENSKYEKKAPGDRAADARSLASLERTLERLARTERERAAMRNSKAMKKDGSARKELDRKIDSIIAIEFARSSSQESE